MSIIGNPVAPGQKGPGTLDQLKAEVNASGFALWSDTVGDRVTFHERYFTRTSNEPAILLFARTNTDEYSGYGMITISPTISYTNGQYGEIGMKREQNTGDTEFYTHAMNYMWGSASGGNITCVLDGVSKTLPFSAKPLAHVYDTVDGIGGTYWGTVVNWVNRMGKLL